MVLVDGSLLAPSFGSADFTSVSSAIKMIQELRLCVTRVTEQLSNGMKKPGQKDTQTKEKLFLFDLQKSLLAVNTHMRFGIWKCL